MKKLLTIILALFVLTTISQAQVYSTTTGGNWSTTTTWSGGVVPSATDSVIIQGPVTLYMGVPTIHHLQITEAGSLLDGWACTLTVTGNVWMNGVVNCTAGANFEFNIGGDLHLNGNWLGDLTFTGTNDHYLSTASDIIFNPYNHILALESKIIALSDIHINSINYPNIVAKEIDLSVGYSLYLSKIRLGQAYYFTNGNIRTKVTGGTGSAIYMNVDSPAYMDQWFIEYCDLQDVTLKGNIFIGGGVKCFGEVINGDSLYTAVGTGSWIVDVQGNFTNNGVVNCNLKFNFSKNFTNDGEFKSQDVMFVGNTDHIFKTLNQNYVNFTSKLHSVEGKVVAGSDLYLTSNMNDFVVKELDLSSGFDLHAKNIRIGSDYYAGLYGFRTKITGNTNKIFFNDNQPIDQYFFQACDLYDVTLMGNTYINSNVKFYGEVINGDSLFTSVGTGRWVVGVEGNFTNNGYVNCNLKLEFHKNLKNFGYFKSGEANFIGTDNQYIIFEQPITSDIDFRAMTGTATYQWQKDGVDISGANQQTLSFNSGLSTSNYGSYQCTVDGAPSRIITVGNTEPAAFEITDVVITNLNATQTKVEWKTTVPATGFIFYAENDASSGYPYEAMEESGLVLEHSLTLDTLHFGSTYYFIIDQNDEAWANNIRSEEFMFVAGDSLVSVKNEFQIPANYSLSQNFPNPFNPSTIVKYGLPEQSNVKVEIFNMLGQSVTVLVDAEKSAGFYEATWNASNLASGIYLISIQANGLSSNKNFTQVKKALLLK